VRFRSYGACDLGAINLTRLIRDPFTSNAHLDNDRLASVASTAVRLLDNVIDVSHFPLTQQRIAIHKARRIGLGITGLADALIMLGMRYGDDASLAFAGETMRTICHASHRGSIALAMEKGCFPDFDRERYLEAPFIRGLPVDIRDGIARHGIRNSHLLAIAPTGTISLLSGNVSSGIEPVFAPEYRRTVLEAVGAPREFLLHDYAVRLWRKQSGRSDGIPDALVTAATLPIEAHLAMQAALQIFIDNSISKTINVPAETAFSDFAPIYRLAYDKGLKGCTTFSANSGAGCGADSEAQGGAVMSFNRRM
jgi:ribonucleoside-diphosphate reductase alpha chain